MINLNTVIADMEVERDMGVAADTNADNHGYANGDST